MIRRKHSFASTCPGSIPGLYPHISVFRYYWHSSPRSGFHYPVLAPARRRKRQLPITFDDGPDPSNTPALLDILKKHQVPAAFFLVGRRIAANEESGPADRCGRTHYWHAYLEPQQLVRFFHPGRHETRTGDLYRRDRPGHGEKSPAISARHTESSTRCWHGRSENFRLS